MVFLKSPFLWFLSIFLGIFPQKFLKKFFPRKIGQNGKNFSKFWKVEFACSWSKISIFFTVFTRKNDVFFQKKWKIDIFEILGSFWLHKEFVDSIFYDQHTKKTHQNHRDLTSQDFSRFDLSFVLWSDFGDFSADAIFSKPSCFAKNGAKMWSPLLTTLENIISHDANASKEKFFKWNLNPKNDFWFWPPR